MGSAGTGAMAGQDAPDEIWDVAAGFGLKRTAKHSARQLTAEMITSADLVISATKEHRAQVARLDPKSASYSFTLNQFARLISHQSASFVPLTSDPLLALRDVVAEVARNRGAFAPPADGASDDVSDPYRLSVSDYQRAGEQISESVDTIVKELRASLQGGSAQ